MHRIQSKPSYKIGTFKFLNIFDPINFTIVRIVERFGGYALLNLIKKICMINLFIKLDNFLKT